VHAGAADAEAGADFVLTEALRRQAQNLVDMAHGYSPFGHRASPCLKLIGSSERSYGPSSSPWRRPSHVGPRLVTFDRNDWSLCSEMGSHFPPKQLDTLARRTHKRRPFLCAVLCFPSAGLTYPWQSFPSEGSESESAAADRLAANLREEGLPARTEADGYFCAGLGFFATPA
jgi:hypothetical protein